MISTKHLCLSIGNKRLLDRVEIEIPQGQLTTIIGPNGAGKTTLLNLIGGDVKPTSGCVFFDGHPLAKFDRLSLARRRAILPQVGSIPFAIKIRDIVALGRSPYRYQVAQKFNQDIIDECLGAMVISHLANHYYAGLSGGERHRVHIARTLAQIQSKPNENLRGKVLFLDEPTNHLDILYQYRLMHLIKYLQKKHLTIVAVMHDLSLALQFSDKIILLSNGKKVGDYTPETLVLSDDLSKTYQIDMHITWDEKKQRYWLAPQL